MAHHAPGAIFILNTSPQHPTPQGVFLCPAKITFQVVYGLGWALDLPFLLLLFLWGVADPDQVCFASISLFVLCPLKSPSHFPAIYSQFAWAKNHPVLHVTEIFHGFPIFWGDYNNAWFLVGNSVRYFLTSICSSFGCASVRQLTV